MEMSVRDFLECGMSSLTSESFPYRSVVFAALSLCLFLLVSSFVLTLSRLVVRVLAGVL